jgi:hypothetical protein
MTCYNSARILCIASFFVVAVSGHWSESDVVGDIESYLLGQDIFSDIENYENAAAMKVDFGSCEAETYETQCQTAELESDYPVHVCPTDGKA